MNHVEAVSVGEGFSNKSKLSSLAKEILKEYDLHIGNDYKESHILWIETLCAYFDSSVQISCDKLSSSESGSEEHLNL